MGGILSVSLCKLLNLIGLPCQGAYVMIGTIMILIPGLLTTNAVRDMFTGDLMSGTFQLLNGILLSVVIAAGYSLNSTVAVHIPTAIPKRVKRHIIPHSIAVLVAIIGETMASIV